MPQPVTPLSPPSGILLPVDLPPHTILTIFFWFALGFWSLYTLVAIYHWIKYSHASAVAYPAIVLHLAVSLALVSYAFSGLV